MAELLREQVDREIGRGDALAAELRFPDAVHEVELVEQPGRHRHGSVDALATFLQRLEHDGLAG